VTPSVVAPGVTHPSDATVIATAPVKLMNKNTCFGRFVHNDWFIIEFDDSLIVNFSA